ncbi:MAG: YceI family protein [Elusimicrobia bacterium]|nr:YceI family protein [Elusimicrobiota bacterium]MDE2237201.1 YceI family protein [Elusimicrobiota bacterium]MDE2425995.1 YceI family protein [Elusimicrobiota bacterium]
MKKIIQFVIVSLAIILVPAAQAAFQAGLAEGSKIWLEGESTLHAYESQATFSDLELVFSSASSLESLSSAVVSELPARLTLSIPVAALRSPHRLLDKNMARALKAERFPEIVFAMDRYSVAGRLESGAATVTAYGELSVAGRTRPERIEAALSFKEGRIIIDGQQPLLMTDFGVRPPRLAFGAIKTADRVVIRFHLVLEKAHSDKEKKS